MANFVVPSDLTEAQNSGWSCVVCNEVDGTMIPVGMGRGENAGQVFAHDGCAFSISATSRAGY